MEIEPPNSLDDDIRERIKERLAILDLSVKGAAKKAGLGDTTLRNFLDGMTDSLTIKTLGKLAKVLGVSARWLMSGGDQDGWDEGVVIHKWRKVPKDQREQVLRVLDAYAPTGTDG